MARSVELSVFFILLLVLLVEGAQRYKPGSESEVLCDDCFKRISLNTTFNFYCKPQRDIFINENGAISFGQDFWSFSPDPFPLTGDDAKKVVIAPFWTDHFMESGGKLFVRRVTNSKEIKSSANQIKKMFRDCHNDFWPKEVLVITFQDIYPYCDSGKNTYQLIMLTDGVQSYIILEYKTLEWADSCPQEYAVVGFHSGTGKHFELPGSGTADVTRLAREKNTKNRGRWAYRVSGRQPVTMDCKQGDTCDITTRPELVCKCRSTNAEPPELKTYDGKVLAITRAQKTMLTQWGNKTDDPCKWTVVARSFDRYKSKSVDVFIHWMAINVGRFPKAGKKTKFNRSYKILEGKVYVRGHDSNNDKLITLPHFWVSDDGGTDISIFRDGDTIRSRCNRCPYALDVTQDGHITTAYTIYAGKRYVNMDGMCGDCDDDPGNDDRLCGGLGKSSDHDAITASCEKIGRQLVG